MSMLTRHDSPLIEKMRPGHLANTGHPLAAHLESSDGLIWSVVRTCCKACPECGYRIPLADNNFLEHMDVYHSENPV